MWLSVNESVVLQEMASINGAKMPLSCFRSLHAAISVIEIGCVSKNTFIWKLVGPWWQRRCASYSKSTSHWSGVRSTAEKWKEYGAAVNLPQADSSTKSERARKIPVKETHDNSEGVPSFTGWEWRNCSYSNSCPRASSVLYGGVTLKKNWPDMTSGL